MENEDCKIIIVLSHSGFDVDQEIATKLVPHVNLIVGSHSHTLLYNGEPPNSDIPAGPYPFVVNRENGRKVLIVQASSYTKYIGNLTVWYNNEGDVINWDGNPIYLSNEIPQGKNYIGLNRKNKITMFSNLSREQNVWVKDGQYLYHIYLQFNFYSLRETV